jgi:hypothetical protein
METMLVSAIDEENSRRTVARILCRLQRYVRGYLPDARIDTEEDFSKNPAEVRIRVWWKDGKAQDPSEW